MTILYVMAVILGLLMAVALLRIRINLTYTEDIIIELRILFLRFRLYPKEKKVNVRRYTYKRYRKRLLKQRKKEKNNSVKQTAQAPQKEKKKRPIKQNLRLYTYLFKKLYAKILHRFRIDVAQLHITVATGDAAQTAIATGIVNQTVSYILEILHQHANLHHSYRADVAVTPDFLGEKSRVACNISFSLRVCEIIEIGIRFFYHFLVGRTNRHNLSSKQGG
jgi:hypothetical protein